MGVLDVLAYTKGRKTGCLARGPLGGISTGGSLLLSTVHSARLCKSIPKGYTITEMETPKTKHVLNVSDTAQVVVGFGRVEPEAVIEVPLDFNNANFETLPVISREEAKKQGVDVDKVEKAATKPAPKK